MKTINEDFPLLIKIGFRKVFDYYRTLVNSENKAVRDRVKLIMDIEKQHPILSNGLTSASHLKKYKAEIDEVLYDLFTPALGMNEIKTATIPFQELVFKSSPRYDKIIDAAGKDHKLELVNFDDNNSYIMGCSIILNMYYGFNADFRRPFHYNIPDKNGRLKNYKVLFNADFIEIEKTDKAKEITDADYLHLLENFDNVEVWKEKFPPGSYVSKGFIIANMYDATMDVALSDFKANLLKDDAKGVNNIAAFQEIIRSIFNLPDLRIGYSYYNYEEGVFEATPAILKANSYILNGRNIESCDKALCKRSYNTLFEKHEFYCISDVEYYHKLYPTNTVYKSLHEQKVQSAILASIIIDDKVLGVLEIVSPNPKDLNTVNSNKLLDIMPYLVDSVRRSKEKEENEIELLIQKECTSIHPSVHWKFKKEASRVIKGKLHGKDISFREIVFENVYPLYGQIDIKGSSEARNSATKNDLSLQLKLVQRIMKRIYKLEPLPIYEQMSFTITDYLKNVEVQLQVDSERNIIRFLRDEILPLFDHLLSKGELYKTAIKEYFEKVEAGKDFIYKHRKSYDESVMLINKNMASILDGKQVEAQQMYPHYFERFKTDGVEHSLYIGESITKQDSFNKIYLYNLRLWQLQAMCEMENNFYRLKETLPLPLDVASMILVFGSSLSLRFRMDEKRFDVDGTYNARYEVVKKRVDKANIKGTDERITQAGKISIIYSQNEDEREYLKYISFLQSKKQLGRKVEILELEDLQGVTGLRAIRVNVLYNFGKKKDQEYYTYEDLMKEIEDA